MAANTIVSDAPAQAEVERLTAEVRQLEDELQALHTAIAREELYIIDGYLVSVSPGTIVAFVAFCPTLKALAQGDSFEEVLSELKDSMQTSIEGRQATGTPIPPRDVDAKWLA